MKKPSKFKRKAAAAKRSLTVWFAAACPILLAAAEALKDNLGNLDGYLSGWGKVALSCAVSAVVVALRLRSVGKGE